jgi:hypothetical protein
MIIVTAVGAIFHGFVTSFQMGDEAWYTGFVQKSTP